MEKWPKELRTVLRYEPETGLFRWQMTRNCRGGGIRPGDTAGTPKDGYVQIIFTGAGKIRHQYRAHRLAWWFMTGDPPPKEMDHINGDRSDNRWSNLREVTRSQNNMNGYNQRRDNKSGQRGVSFRADSGKWHARIQVDGVITSLGDYADLDHAIAVRRKAEKHFFGKFAPRRTK